MIHLGLRGGLRLDQEGRHKHWRVDIRHKSRRVDIQISELVGELLVPIVIPAVRSTVGRHLSLHNKELLTG